MKRQKKTPGSIIVWWTPFANDGNKVSLRVAVKGIEGYLDVPWDRSDPRGGFYVAAKNYAVTKGYIDVKEVGTLQRGVGFIYEPVAEVLPETQE